jgi:hypothetical protein
MGIYCSLTCLRRSMERLEGLDRMFREKGVGTRPAEAANGRQLNGGRE